MKIFKNKKILSMMAMLMILSFAASMIAVPNANAQTVNNQKTYPFVDAIPHKAGVGQPVLINWGLLNFLSTTTDGFNATLVITSPSNKVTEEKAKTWSTGTVGRKMSFMEPGNYTLQCVYNEENITTGTGTNQRITRYLASKSENVTLEIVEGYWKMDHPGHTQPAEYWTRPVDGQLREWYSIMGSWVAKPANLYAPWNDAPESAHILWNMPLGETLSGIAGGDNGPVTFNVGDAYEGRFADSVIIAGTLFYNKGYNSNNGAAPNSAQTIVAVELRTGKVLWEKQFELGNGRLSRGQILTFISENNRAAWAYLWIGNSGTMYAINPATGEHVYTMTGVPTQTMTANVYSGTFFLGPSGELLRYSVVNYGNAQNPNYHLLQWNSTYVVNNGTRTSTNDAWGSQVQSRATGNVPRTFAADRLGYDLNVSIGSTNPGSVIVAWPCDRVVLSTTPSLTAGIFLTAISLDKENLGQPIYTRREFKAPAEWVEGNVTIGGIGQAGWAAFSQEDYRAVFRVKENRVNYVFNLETGRLAWQSEPQIYADAWSDTITSYGPDYVFAYGKLYSASVGGIVYCYDANNGTLIWTYEALDKYNESYHREAWWLVPVAVSSGKIYLGHMTHSPQQPIPRGAPFIALDCETGDVVWEIDGAFRQTRWGGRALMGDSVLVTADTYDQQIYAIGKGPSELTVSAPNVAITAGTTALISGTVMDVSPGTQTDKMRLRFPGGVPAVGDESMSEWMLYVYKGFSQPMATGIEITVYAYDGHDVIDIGKTMSDARGRYSITWTPEKEGSYDIWAYFDGTASFYGDDAKTEMHVSAAPVIEEVETPPYEWYIVGMGLAILAAVIIFGLLSLRKK